MNKISILFKREYKAAVKTKSFIISLVLLPFIMSGGLIVVILNEDKIDTEEKKVVIIDHSGILEEPIKESIDLRNKKHIFDPQTNKQILPVYNVEFHQSDTVNPFQQQLLLSEKARSKEIHAFIEIGAGILKPGENPETAYIKYYSEHSFNDEVRNWLNNNINNVLREIRAKEINLDPSVSQNLFAWSNMETMGLVNVDKKTGEEKAAEKNNPFQSFIIPYIFLLLMFMLTMMSAAPLLTSVMEEKTEKIAEVLLAKVTPFEFMMGKVLGGIGIALTVSGIYVIGGILIASQTGNANLIPYEILPWFFAFLVLYILMVGAGMAALGATCNDNKDAQSMQFPAMILVILPIFVIFPVIQDPDGSLATTLSLIPPFTPPIMMTRMATPVSVPIWQPIAGMILVILFTFFTVWLGARIFRTAILIQGQKPTIGRLFNYAFRYK